MGENNSHDAGQWQFAVRLVEILLSGAFVLGLTTVAGAVWFAGQLRGVGLTGTEAVSAIPRAELLTKGADQLIPFALIAVGELTILVFVRRELEKGPPDHDPDIIVATVASSILLVGGVGLLFYRAGLPTGRGKLAWSGTLAIVVLGTLNTYRRLGKPALGKSDVGKAEQA
jgi:hypothetical protein